MAAEQRRCAGPGDAGGRADIRLRHAPLENRGTGPSRSSGWPDGRGRNVQAQGVIDCYPDSAPRLSRWIGARGQALHFDPTGRDRPEPQAHADAGRTIGGRSTRAAPMQPFRLSHRDAARQFRNSSFTPRRADRRSARPAARVGHPDDAARLGPDSGPARSGRQRRRRGTWCPIETGFDGMQPA